MANIKSKKKNVKRIQFQTARNSKTKTELKTFRKKIEKADSEEAKKSAAASFASLVGKALKHGIIHKNKASRLQSVAARTLFAKASA